VIAKMDRKTDETNKRVERIEKKIMMVIGGWATSSTILGILYAPRDCTSTLG
jgi:hypothetical protein